MVSATHRRLAVLALAGVLTAVIPSLPLTHPFSRAVQPVVDPTMATFEPYAMTPIDDLAAGVAVFVVLATVLSLVALAGEAAADRVRSSPSP